MIISNALKAQGYAPTSMTRPAAAPTPAPADQFQSSHADRLPGKPVFSARNARTAVQLAGVGIMFGGIMASAAMGGSWAPALMIGSMFGGLAVMALGR